MREKTYGWLLVAMIILGPTAVILGIGAFMRRVEATIAYEVVCSDGEQVIFRKTGKWFQVEYGSVDWGSGSYTIPAGVQCQVYWLKPS